MRTRRIALLPGLLALLFLSGCAGLWPETAEPPRKLDFGPHADDASEPAIDFPVRLARVHAPSWLEQEEIYYRDLSSQPNRLASYGRHVWLAAVPELLGEEVDGMLAARSDSRSGATGRLELRLTRFEQVLEDEDEAHVRAHMTAVLERDGERHKQVFTVREEVAADVTGAREGLPKAGRALVGQLGDWLAEQG